MPDVATAYATCMVPLDPFGTGLRYLLTKPNQGGRPLERPHRREGWRGRPLDIRTVEKVGGLDVNRNGAVRLFKRSSTSSSSAAASRTHGVDLGFIAAFFAQQPALTGRNRYEIGTTSGPAGDEAA